MRRASLLLLAVLAGCGSSVDVLTAAPDGLGGVQNASNALMIGVRKATYGWEEASFNGTGVIATLSNPTARSYFARIGDAFNSAAEQSPVFIANGSDAAIERQNADGTWSVVSTGQLVEGAKVVTIRGGGAYELRGNLAEPRQVGTMRIRLRYFMSSDGTGTPMLDYSPTFIVH